MLHPNPMACWSQPKPLQFSYQTLQEFLLNLKFHPFELKVLISPLSNLKKKKNIKFTFDWIHDQRPNV